MKKILIISFYWLPSGKASLHLPLKIAEILQSHKWMPTILTVEKDSVSKNDPSLVEPDSGAVRIIRTKFWDPFSIYKKILGKDSGTDLEVSETISKSGASITKKISLWIRMNLFVPDARIGWRFSGYREAIRKIKNENFDLILSNGPPHSTHLLSKKISKKLNIPMVSIFIDPWVDISYYKGHSRNYLTRKLDEHLEKSVLKFSKKSIFVTKELENYFIKKYPFLTGKTDLIYWGYNESDFTNLEKKKENEKKVILHAGNMYDHQNPINFWQNIKKQIDSGSKLSLKFIGSIGPEIKNSLNNYGLENYSTFLGFLPYKEVIQEIYNADYLLVCVAEPRHVPGKIFEYMRSSNPIIAFGKDNREVKSMLKETNSGILFNYDDEQNYLEQVLKMNPKLDEVKKYSREQLVERLVHILEQMVRKD